MVIKEVESICKNYLWGAKDRFVRAPMVSWETMGKAKNNGGAGLKDTSAWNTALVTKYIWDVAMKKVKSLTFALKGCMNNI